MGEDRTMYVLGGLLLLAAAAVGGLASGAPGRLRGAPGDPDDLDC